MSYLSMAAIAYGVIIVVHLLIFAKIMISNGEGMNYLQMAAVLIAATTWPLVWLTYIIEYLMGRVA